MKCTDVKSLVATIKGLRGKLVKVKVGGDRYLGYMVGNTLHGTRGHMRGFIYKYIAGELAVISTPKASTVFFRLAKKDLQTFDNEIANLETAAESMEAFVLAQVYDSVSDGTFGNCVDDEDCDAEEDEDEDEDEDD